MDDRDKKEAAAKAAIAYGFNRRHTQEAGGIRRRHTQEAYRPWHYWHSAVDASLHAVSTLD